MSNGSPSLPPGFRFHPTDEELILHYLRNRLLASPCPASIIADVDIYKYNPWDLPEKAMFGDREWYFFSPRDRKYPNGIRPNRAAASGFWKATGTDKPIIMTKGNEKIGVKKALVFYKGKPPKGVKTNWIMHEYRLVNNSLNKNKSKTVLKHNEDYPISMRLDDWVLCRIYQRTNYNALVNAEQEESGREKTSVQKMKKSFSVSELLIDEVDFSLLSPVLDHMNPFSDRNLIQPLNVNMNDIDFSCSTSQGIESDHQVSGFISDNSLKRQRNYYGFEEFGECFNPSKNMNTFSQFYEQVFNQSDISQPFFYQQLMLNSHLGSL